MLVDLTSSLLFRQIRTWLTGLSLSTVVIFSILFVISIVLRRKGYGVRLGIACLVLHACPGSRRFPDGVQVRLTTRLVGFLVGGCRGPWLDVSSDKFHMRLRPNSPTQTSSFRRFSIPRISFMGVSAVDSNNWSVIFQNVLVRILALFIRGLRIRIGKVHLWKDGGSWQFIAEQFVFSGRASGLFGSQYCMSVNELDIDMRKEAVVTPSVFQPVQTTLSFQRGIEVTAHLTPRIVSLFRRRRIAILDDLRVCINASCISFNAPLLFQSNVALVTAEICPGYSRSLQAKLPVVAPPARRPRQSSIVPFYEATVSLHSVSARFSLPETLESSQGISRSGIFSELAHLQPPLSKISSFPHIEGQPNFGGFVRFDSFRLDAYGKSGDERFEGMTHCSVCLHGCSAGSTSVDSLSQRLFETVPECLEVKNDVCMGSTSIGANSVENIEKLISAKPEALIWIEDLSVAVDVNVSCCKNLTRRMDIAGSGCVFALEPVGIVSFVHQAQSFCQIYFPPANLTNTDGNDSSENMSWNGSPSTVSSISDEIVSIRLVADLRHWTVLLLSHGPMGDGDTVALVASTECISLPQMDVVASSLLRVFGSVQNLELIHWSRWDRTKNITCEKLVFDVQRGTTDANSLIMTNIDINWDLDAHSAFENAPILLKLLKRLRHFRPSFAKGQCNSTFPNLLRDHGHMHLGDSKQNVLQDKKHLSVLNILRTWEVAAENLSISASFPDGPKFAVTFGRLPKFRLNAEIFIGEDIVFFLQERKFAYVAELKLGSFFHTMNNSLERRSINIDAQKLHVVLDHESPFGYLLQDWILRLRSTISVIREARLRKRGLSPSKVKKKPMADIHFKATNLEIHFEDHPISGFLTVMLPLMQDEARERVSRDTVMDRHIEKLRKIARAEIAGTPYRCLQALRMKDSEIWIQRAQRLKEKCSPKSVGNNFLPALERPPAASLAADSLAFDVTLDDLAREMGSAESIRRLKMLDDYELGPKKDGKSRQYDRDAWNSIGFRAVGLEAIKVCVQLRDYPRPFLLIDRMYFDNTTIGQAVQATKEPYICKTKIAIGRRRVVEVVKCLAPTKTFADIHLKVDTLYCAFNPSYITGIADFGRGISRFFGGGRDPSPRIPWFDSLRISMHGRMRLTAKKFKGLLTSSVSPYSMTNHFVNFESDNFEMLTSRLNPTEEDPFPICWKFNKWRICPSTFDESRRSEIFFEFVRVGINPILSVNCGDPQDHYFVPFPSKEEVTRGGPGIGGGTSVLQYSDGPVGISDDGFGSHTVWWTGLHEISGADSYAGYKTQSIEMCIFVHVKHPMPKKSHIYEERYNLCSGGPPLVHFPESHSVAYSDAISTLTKVIRTIVQRPISCRLPSRQQSLNRKPPSTTGLSTSLKKIQITVDAKNLNVVLHNNLEPGHSLYISIDSLEGELRKTTKVTILDDGDVHRESEVTKRRFDIQGIYCSIRVPGLDLAVDCDDSGKLLTINKISLFDNIEDEKRLCTSPRRAVASSGFGSEDLDSSPFYTFSATHPLQRGKPLDKVPYSKRLSVDRVRLIWSPARRISMFAWPDAFKLKTFSMKMSNYGVVDNIMGEESTPGTQGNGILSRKIASDVETDSGDLSSSVVDPDCDGKFVLSETTPFVQSRKNFSEQRTTSSAGSPVMALSRSKIMVKRKHVGSMIDLLEPSGLGNPFLTRTQCADTTDIDFQIQKKACGTHVLESSPQFSLYINDCEVGFGSHATSGIVFLTSRSVRAGIVDKRVQKVMQLSQTSEEWVDREYRFHLDTAEVFTRDKAFGEFNFKCAYWVWRNGSVDSSFALVTQKPICMDLMYISSSSVLPNGEDEIVDSLRPKLLFINVPNIKLSTNASEFHAVTDVVRKVLMQSMRSSELVNEELSHLRYKLQLAGGKVSSEDLKISMQRLDCVTRQFLYAGDTFQQHLVQSLMLPNEPTFYDNLLRYKAKAKALATFMRKDLRATITDVLFPTMYISYSFDKFSWELREKHKELNKEIEDPFVEMALEDLVCRHIFYVGRGSSTEVTFANINAQNKMRNSYFQRILQPAGSATSYGPGDVPGKVSSIKASDGAAVAFRWYSTQEDRVGGIPVYDLLTIQVAPMTAAVTRKLYSSVSGFVFSTLSTSAEETDDIIVEGKLQGTPLQDSSKVVHLETNSVGSMVSTKAGSSDSAALKVPRSTSRFVSKEKVDEVLEMAQRGEKNMLFKYVYIDAFELTASYKNKESTAQGALDFIDLFVNTPSFSYSSEIWTWEAFSKQVTKDLVKTFVLRGVSNLAKIKLLPGYNRAKKRLAKGADSVRETFYSHLPSAAENEVSHIQMEDEQVQDALKADDSDDIGNDADLDGDAEGRIDAAVADISGEEDSKRERVLIALYGLAMIKGSGRDEGKSRKKLLEYSDNDSTPSYGSFRHQSHNRGNASSHTHTSSQPSEDGKRATFGRFLRRTQYDS